MRKTKRSLRSKYKKQNTRKEKYNALSQQRYLYHAKHYKTSACLSCSALSLCTKNKQGRLIERTEYQGYMDQNKENIQRDPATDKRRQAIIEHTYGIIKRQWTFIL